MVKKQEQGNETAMGAALKKAASNAGKKLTEIASVDNGSKHRAEPTKKNSNSTLADFLMRMFPGEDNKKEDEDGLDIDRVIADIDSSIKKENERDFDDWLKKTRMRERRHLLERDSALNPNRHSVAPQFNQFKTPRSVEQLQHWHNQSEKDAADIKVPEPQGEYEKLNSGNANLRNPFVRFGNYNQFPNPNAGRRYIRKPVDIPTLTGTGNKSSIKDMKREGDPKKQGTSGSETNKTLNSQKEEYRKWCEEEAKGLDQSTMEKARELLNDLDDIEDKDEFINRIKELLGIIDEPSEESSKTDNERQATSGINESDSEKNHVSGDFYWIKGKRKATGVAKDAYMARADYENEQSLAKKAAQAYQKRVTEEQKEHKDGKQENNLGTLDDVIDKERKDRIRKLEDKVKELESEIEELKNPAESPDNSPNSQENQPSNEQAGDEPNDNLPEPSEEGLESAKDLFKKNLYSYANKLAIGNAEVGDLEKAESFWNTLTPAKRFGLKVATGLAVAAGVGVASAGAALVAPMLGITLGVGYVGMGTIIGSKILGGYLGNKLFRRFANKNGLLDRAKITAGIARAKKEFKRQERMADVMRGMGYNAPPVAMTQSQIETLMKKGMRKDAIYQALTTAAVVGGVGALYHNLIHWHLDSTPTSGGETGGADAGNTETRVQVTPAGGGAPAPQQSPASPIPAPDAPAPQQSPASPSPHSQPIPASDAPAPQSSPIPASDAPASHHPQKLPNRFFESQATDWNHRVHQGHFGEPGSPLSVDQIGGHIDSLTHAPTFTEGVQDILTKAGIARRMHMDNRYLQEDFNLLADKLAQTLDKGLYGADSILQKIGITDVDSWQAGHNYNLRPIFEDRNFMTHFLKDVVHDSRFHNNRAVAGLIRDIVIRA